MLGLGSNASKSLKAAAGKWITTDNLVLRHDYRLHPVQPLSAGAASFNTATSDYIAINAKPVDTADGTYAWWSNSTQSTYSCIFSHGVYNIGAFYQFYTTDNMPLLYLAATKYQYWVDSGFADDGKWHHWALVIDISSMSSCKLYCDGVEITQAGRNDAGTATSYNNMEIGKYNSTEFDGYMCNFGVWSSHLSQAQIKSIMWKNYAGLSASEKTDLVSWWNLDSVIPDTTTFVYDNYHGGGNTLGSEMVTNGGFDADSDWTKGSGWTISGGTANYDGVISIGDIWQSISFDVGALYKYTFTISSLTQGGVRVFIGNTVGSIHSSNGTFTGYITYASGSFLILQARSSFIGSIDNVSVKLVNGNPGTLS